MVESLAPASAGSGFLLGLDLDVVFEQGAFGHDAGLEVSPQGDQKLARQGNDPDLAQARAAASEAGLVPLRQGTLRLETQPGPGELDRHPAHPPVARLVDAELAAQLPALVGGRCEPRQGADLLAVTEVAPGEELHRVEPGAVQADPAQLHQLPNLRRRSIPGLPDELPPFARQG